MEAASDAPSLLTNRFADALQYAFHLHRQQKRKGTAIPYVSHLLAVTALVLEDGGSEDEAIAALLHDAIEDAGGDPIRQEIRLKFGDRVAAIVEGCTDTDETPKPPWLERKKKYLEHLRLAGPEVRRVSAADKLHNARAVLADFRNHGNAVWERFNGGREGTLWYYRRLVQIYSESGPGSLVEELNRVVSELERLADSVRK
jgi:(p)ppGpp synthase/HD superfamily hydrolase